MYLICYSIVMSDDVRKVWKVGNRCKWTPEE